MDIVKQKRKLIILSVFLVIFMNIFMPLMTSLIGKTIGYIVSNVAYWCGLWIIIAICSSGRALTGLKSFYITKQKGKHNTFYSTAAFLPVIATGIIVFIPTVQKAPALVFLIAIVYALINGTMEELFWRGIYNNGFSQISVAYVIPTLLFSLIHVAFALAKGIVYHGGNITLLGGAAFMGILWGFVAYKTKSIKYTTLAHIATNFFAFSGLIYDNWFKI